MVNKSITVLPVIFLLWDLNINSKHQVDQMYEPVLHTALQADLCLLPNCWHIYHLWLYHHSLAISQDCIPSSSSGVHITNMVAWTRTHRHWVRQDTIHYHTTNLEKTNKTKIIWPIKSVLLNMVSSMAQLENRSVCATLKWSKRLIRIYLNLFILISSNVTIHLFWKAPV